MRNLAFMSIELGSSKQRKKNNSTKLFKNLCPRILFASSKYLSSDKSLVSQGLDKFSVKNSESYPLPGLFEKVRISAHVLLT